MPNQAVKREGKDTHIDHCDWEAAECFWDIVAVEIVIGNRQHQRGEGKAESAAQAKADGGGQRHLVGIREQKSAEHRTVKRREMNHRDEFFGEALEKPFDNDKRHNIDQRDDQNINDGGHIVFIGEIRKQRIDPKREYRCDHCDQGEHHSEQKQVRLFTQHEQHGARAERAGKHCVFEKNREDQHREKGAGVGHRRAKNCFH